MAIRNGLICAYTCSPWLRIHLILDSNRHAYQRRFPTTVFALLKHVDVFKTTRNRRRQVKWHHLKTSFGRYVKNVGPSLIEGLQCQILSSPWFPLMMRYELLFHICSAPLSNLNCNLIFFFSFSWKIMGQHKCRCFGIGATD